MPSTNVILNSLPAGDSAALRPYLRPVHLESKTMLFETGDTVESVYFPTSAVISLIVGLSTGEVTESAMVGKDGVVGASAALDSKIAINSAVVQLPGDALVCDSDAFKGAVLQSQTFISTIMRHSRRSLPNRNSQPRAWRITTSKPGSPAGCFVRVTCGKATICPSRKNFWQRCLEFAGPA